MMNRTKKHRDPRKTVFAQYAIMTESYAYTFWATMKNISKTGALFSIYGDLMQGETIYACPILDPEFKTLPAPQAVKDHPNHLKGKVVRKEGPYLYGIQFESSASSVANLAEPESGVSSTRVEGEDGYFVKITLEGRPSLEDFIRFDAMVRVQCKMAVCIVLDFSRVAQLHQTSAAILSKTLDAQTKEGRYFFIVNASTLGAGFYRRFPSGRNIHYYNDTASAIEWIKDHTPVVLIIEDDETTQLHISKYLECWNFRVVCAASAEEGLQKADIHPPSLFLIDIHLPGMDGIQAVSAIRQSIHSHQTPIIMLTVDSSRETVKRTLQNKIQGYIRKPFHPEKLLKSVVDGICSNPYSLTGVNNLPHSTNA